jgi:hypothetical protein
MTLMNRKEHAEILRQMSQEWRNHDEISEAMLALALRVKAARGEEAK